MKKILIAASLAALMSGAAAGDSDMRDLMGDLGDNSYDSYDSGMMPTPRPSTGATTPAGTVPASGVCCSDGVPQVSSVTIAAAMPSNNPGSGGGGFGGGGGDGGDKGDYNADGSYAGVEMGDYNGDEGEGSFGGDSDGHGGMF